jgi:hypothetical protein
MFSSANLSLAAGENVEELTAASELEFLKSLWGLGTEEE